jgi:DNA-binding transcriptional MerR regulator
MGRDGLLIGEISARSGISRKALRLYETSGILPAPRRTASRYRMYGPDALAVLAFVKQPKRLGFQLKEIKEIVAIRRSGSEPCHVRRLVERKGTELDKLLSDAKQVRDRLRGVLKDWSSRPRSVAAVCPHIESVNDTTPRRTRRAPAISAWSRRHPA